MLNQVQSSTGHQAPPTAASSHPGFLEDLAKKGFVLLSSAGGLEGALAEILKIGRLCAQYDGEYLYDVRFRPGFDHLSYTGSCNPIGPHTEAPIWAKPPRYLALYGIRPARSGGETLLHDMAGPLDALDPSTLDSLRATRVSFSRRNGATPGISVERPLLDDRPGRCLRFSHNLFMRGDIDGRLDRPDRSALERLPPEVREFVEAACDAFEKDAIRIAIPSDALLVWDNHRFLHGRTGYRDPDRHLIRMWIDGDPG